ncbi:hypothetical protein [Sphingomonas asaccharolytica]|uniref:hypothetical protein n=1 Tax=Sphingomonas asaccharolytica TaxID=40681 RepID=UPI0012EE9776|nr:hypothetical protein [Sphingomonas asaccharolytica]
MFRLDRRRHVAMRVARTLERQQAFISRRPPFDRLDELTLPIVVGEDGMMFSLLPGSRGVEFTRLPIG